MKILVVEDGRCAAEYLRQGLTENRYAVDEALAHEMRTPVATLLGRTQVALARQRSVERLHECSNGSCAWTRPEQVRREAPGWDCPSSSPSCKLTAAASTSRVSPQDRSPSSCACALNDTQQRGFNSMGLSSGADAASRPTTSAVGPAAAPASRAAAAAASRRCDARARRRASRLRPNRASGPGRQRAD